MPPSPSSAAAPIPGYRPDIDGLRAIAVLSVLLYHLDFPAFSGGFVGVDVFFVISGFLITRLIKNEHARTGTLGFRRFYLRRVRRLVPAQLFVSILCTVSAAAWLAPPHLKSFGGSLASAVASCSNFFFWSQFGYFDTESSLKPLLHTWSLGVEEQFYFVWPAALILALRSRRFWIAPVLLLAAGAVSLAMNQVFLDGSVAVAERVGIGLPQWLATKEWLADGQSTIFYLLPFRVFEFAIGGVLVWLIGREPRSETAADALVLTGLALIAYAVLTFDQHTTFPSFNALVPTLGAGLCIYAGQARRTGVILRNPAAVRIGLASYSLYLVHWPLFVFWSYSRSAPLSLGEKALIIAISILSALVMLRWVEQPFRNPAGSSSEGAPPRGQMATLLGLLAVAATLFAIGFNMWSTDGWAWRYSDTIVAEEMKLKAEDFNKFVWKRMTAIHVPFSDDPKPKMLIVGDSMAADFTNIAFAAALDEEFEIRSIPVRDSCRSILPLSAEESDEYGIASTCAEQHAKAAANPSWGRADIVVLAFLWNRPVEKLLLGQIDELRGLAPDATFVVVGTKVQNISGIDLLTRIARSGTSPNLREYTTQIADLQRHLMNDLRTMAQNIGIPVFDVNGVICPRDQCPRFTEFGNMIFFDTMHLTPKGSEFVGRRLRSRIAEYPYFQPSPSAMRQ